jgi:hypothetical protein
MRIEITNRKRSSSIFSAIFVVLSAVSCSVPRNCDEPNIQIYQGIYFSPGDHVNLNLGEGALVWNDKFNVAYKKRKYKLIAEFCCKEDSCQVTYRINDRDTTFYIDPGKTKRLMIGSNSKKALIVATDAQTMAWIDI